MLVTVDPVDMWVGWKVGKAVRKKKKCCQYRLPHVFDVFERVFVCRLGSEHGKAL